jgi:putative tricarboxylic transport membrane protein
MNNDQVSSVAFLLIGAAICLGSIQYKIGTLSEPNSGLMPFLVGAGICFFSAIGFFQATLQKKRGEGWHKVFEGFLWTKVLIVLACLWGYVLLINFMGFFFTATLFIGILLRAVVPQRWPAVILGGVFTALCSYWIFEVWLMAQLPKGPLGF